MSEQRLQRRRRANDSMLEQHPEQCDMREEDQAQAAPAQALLMSVG
jgi:hypothetical protein